MSHEPAPFTRLITAHGPKPSSDPAYASEPSTIYHASSGTAPWQQILSATWFSLVYTSDSRPNLNEDADVGKHEKLFDSGETGLVNPAGSVCRVVEWAPKDPNQEAEPFMHRTLSLDYGIVLQGSMELSLPDESPRILKQGDICVQRATLHSWRNASSTEPARMVFVLLAAEEPITAGGKTLGEVYPTAPPESGTSTEDVLKAKRT